MGFRRRAYEDYRMKAWWYSMPRWERVLYIIALYIALCLILPAPKDVIPDFWLLR